MHTFVNRPTVAILQRRLTHYRVPLFERLHGELEKRGIDLLLVHGQPTRAEAGKRDEGVLPWANTVRNAYVQTGATTLCWLPVPEEARRANLLVLQQENSMLSNYPLLCAPRRADRKLAYWGHGENRQSRAPTGVRERWKQLWLRRVDWWFAYTELTEALLRERGVPGSRITCLDNAIDTSGFRLELASVKPPDVAALRARHRVPDGAPIGLYCGSLYPDKQLDLLIEACVRIRRRVPQFMLAIVGEGPEMTWLRRRIRAEDWVIATGALRGRDKAAWFRAASVVLNPGLVGLGVLDALCAGLPMVTTRGARHSPEIAYLRDRHNGLMTDDSVADYADAVATLLERPAIHRLLGSNALRDGQRYTIEGMAQRFSDGIARALALG